MEIFTLTNGEKRTHGKCFRNWSLTAAGWIKTSGYQWNKQRYTYKDVVRSYQTLHEFSSQSPCVDLLRKLGEKENTGQVLVVLIQQTKQNQQSCKNNTFTPTEQLSRHVHGGFKNNSSTDFVRQTEVTSGDWRTVEGAFIGLVNYKQLRTVGGYTETHFTVRYLQQMQLKNNTINNSNINIIIIRM